MKVDETFRLYMTKMQECDVARTRRSRAAAEMVRPFLDPSIKTPASLVAQVKTTSARMVQASDAIIKLQDEAKKIKTDNPDVFASPDKS
jgi:hypothetical protein